MSNTATRQRARGPQEARRRAAILARYVELALPDEADDERFAAELGLSTESLARLAATWRSHRDPDMLIGSGVRVNRRKAASDADAMAADVDLDGVHPSRRRATLRRVRAIQGYLAGSGGSSEAVARRLGVSPTYFQRLVRIWLLHKRASALPGANVVTTRTWRRRQGPRRQVHEILRRTVAAAPEGTTVVEIFAKFQEEVRAAGLKPLAIARVYALVRQYRRDAKE